MFRDPDNHEYLAFKMPQDTLSTLDMFILPRRNI